jgi:spoIIIJ-associated protein
MEKAKDFYSKNVADAIRQACAEFATSQEKLNIEVIETGSAGIFGLCRKRAHIRVTLKKGKAEPSERASKKEIAPDAGGSAGDEVVEKAAETGETKSASEVKSSGKGRGKSKGRQRSKKGEDTRARVKELEPIVPPTEEALAAVKTNLDQILQLMGFPSETKASFDGSSIQCQIDGEHEESIAGTDGRTLDSLQYLLRKMLSSELPDRMMIDLNAGDFRERRIVELKKTAVDLAEKVKADGKTQAIPALNPSERRVVHVTLQDDKSIRSRSVGDGLFKKVLIYKPGSKARKSGGKRRGRQGGGSADK